MAYEPQQLWAGEVERWFPHAARVMLARLSEGRLYLDEELFSSLYPELAPRLREERGWWNPLIHPAVIYHFYGQAILVASPVSSGKEFERLHGISPEATIRLVEEGLLVVLTSSPQYMYQCPCYTRIAAAQGGLPTILRATEPLKAILYDILRDDVYNTKTIHERLQQVLAEDQARDLAVRITDLAALGYKGLAERLLGETLERPGKTRLIARAVHHVLAEPIIDSGATIAAYSRWDLEFIKAATESGSPLAGDLAHLIHRLQATAKLRVPRRSDPEKLVSIALGEEAQQVHQLIAIYKRILHRLSEDPEERIREAQVLARSAAEKAEELNKKIGSPSPALAAAAMGFIAQMPLTAMLSHDNLLELGVYLALETTAAGLAARTTRKLLELLLERVEEVGVVPVTPLLFEPLSP